MSAADLSAGYPIHAVKTYRPWQNEHGAQFTDWTAHCGATGTLSGQQFGTGGSARKAELCSTCWPTGHQTYHPRAVKTAERYAECWRFSECKATVDPDNPRWLPGFEGKRYACEEHAS